MTLVTDPDNLDRFQIAYDGPGETISIRGLGSVLHAVDETGDSDGTSTFTDAGANFTGDGIAAGDVLAIISDPANDGGIIGHYRVVGSVTGTTFEVDRNIPASTAADLTYAVHEPDVAGAAGETVADGVDLQALFSFSKEEWITLAAGLGGAEDLNQYNFPFQAISSAAGQYILGGINGDAESAWAFADDNGVESTDTEGLPRELIRNGGWQERDVLDRVLREYANYTTLGSLDADAQVTYQQGDATGDPADYKLLGAVNQAVLTLGPDVGPDGVTGFAFAATTITRNDGGNWATDNYRVGDYVTIALSENTGENDGSVGPITAVDDSVDGAITIASASMTVNGADTTAVIQVDHRRYTVLRVRKKGRSYAQSTHDDAGIPVTGILPLVNKFGLTHANDPATNTGEDGLTGTGLDDGTISGGDGTSIGDAFQAVETHTSGADGAIPAAVAADGTFTLTSAGSTFDSTARTLEVLQPGDSVEITSGTYQGVYEIVSVDSSTVLTLFAEPGRTYPGVESSLSFTARTGVRDVGAVNATLADVDGDTGTLTSTGSTFDVDTALGDRDVAIDDIVEVYAGDNAVIGYYKVISIDSATVLTLNTSDQIFGGETNQSYRVWRPGMFLQRFETLIGDHSAATVDFLDANPDTIDRGSGSFVTDGYLAGGALTVSGAADAGNDQTFIVDAVAALSITLIAEEAVTADTGDATAAFSQDNGIVRTINAVDYPFHWRLFANGASLDNVFQFLQRELRRATDIDGGSGTERGDITDALMTYVSPNGVTLDLFPDDLSTSELNNVTYTDMSGDARTNAFSVGITFQVNANLISSATKRLTAYFTTNPSGDFGSNDAVIVDDAGGSDMNFTTINSDIQTTFDYTNNAQGGRTPDTDADITVVALGDDLAQHVLVEATITKVNSVIVVVGTGLERNYANA